MISVIIPLYNKAPYVRASVLSVLNQSMPDFELLLVDNGSTDYWREELETISDVRLKILSEPQKGVSYARNCGITHACYDWICFLDADDYWEKDNLLELLKMIQQFPNAGLLSNSYQIKDKQNNIKVRKVKGVEPIGNYQRVMNFFVSYNEGDIPVNSNSVCIPKRVLKEMGGFDTSIIYGEDVLLWVKIVMKYPMYIHNYIGSTYQLGAMNRSNIPAYLLQELPVISKLEEVYKLGKTGESLDHDFHAFIAKHLFVNVMANLKSRNRLAAQNFFKDKRLWYYPHKSRLYLAACLAFFPKVMAEPILNFLEKKGLIN